ncbi:MAG: hypothetical protein ACXVCO_10555 [Ktedonobacterales bacterium]
MRFRPRARAVRNGIVTGLLITLLGAIRDALAVSVGFQAGRPPQPVPLWGTHFGVCILLFAGAGYATTRRAGTVMMGGLAGALAGFIGGIGFAVTWAVLLFAPLALLHAQLGSLLATVAFGALYGLFFFAPVGTGLGVLLGVLGARAGIACRRESAVRGDEA